MKALSIRAPWWWAILYAGKDVENRDWRTSYRGPVLIHASTWWRLHEVADAIGGESYPVLGSVAYMRRQMPNPPPFPGDWTFRQMRDLGGHIVGMATLTDCVPVDDEPSPWATGAYCFRLADPVAFENPIPCKGRLGLFNPPADVLQKVAA